MEDFKIVNTDKIQLRSIVKYMHELGYMWFYVDKVFYSPFRTNKARATISLRNAILAHNGYYDEIHGRGFEPSGLFGNIPYEWWQAANEAKIVNTAHLQRCKKKGNYIKAQKHLVKFVQPDYASLLLKP